MPVYAPENPELGKNAIGRRVSALRAMNEAGGPKFTQYDRSGQHPTYLVLAPSGAVRSLATPEVAPYVLAMADGYDGLIPQVREAVDAALSDPAVEDRETLIAAVLRNLESCYGKHLHAAASRFTETGEVAEVA